MKTVGFIDYYLNEWHADNYPVWIKERSGGEFVVKYAYAKSEPPVAGRISNSEWADKNGITLLGSINELVEKSDCIVVLSPDNSELHEELSYTALCSGKPVYIDKTFADSGEIARRIFKTAKLHNTPCCSTSALRFSASYSDIVRDDICGISSFGGGVPGNYLIHQLEPVIMLMGTGVARVTALPCSPLCTFVLEFSDKRTATLQLYENGDEFSLKIYHRDSCEQRIANDDFFAAFIDGLIRFFQTGETVASQQETIMIMSVREACIRALEKPGEWLTV